VRHRSLGAKCQRLPEGVSQRLRRSSVVDWVADTPRAVQLSYVVAVGWSG
jgi:hypothetical protein